jgi:hypothetical protein
MAKVIWALLSAFAIELALYMFGGTSYETSSLFKLLIDPSGIGASTFYLLIVGAMLAIGATTIIIGTFYNINIYGIYASVTAVLITLSLIMAHLWTFLNGELTSLNVDNSSIIASVIVVPLLAAYMFIVLNYVRAND